MKKTFILRWNPEISSWKKTGFEACYGNGFYDYTIDFPVGMNWSIYQWEDLEVGDDFYMFTTGNDEEAKLVMHGIFTSEPYKSNNWRSESGRRIIHYANFDCLTAFSPDSEDAILVSSFRAQIPDYDFGHGHAGVILDADVAEKLHSALCVRREALLERAKKNGFYTPRQLPPTMHILHEEERVYLQSARKRLVEGYATDVEDEWYEHLKFVIAPDYSRVWDTFWQLAENAFQGKKVDFLLQVEDYNPLWKRGILSLDELRQTLEPYREILEKDTTVSFSFEDNRDRMVKVCASKEIIADYGRKADTEKFIKSLGFGKQKDLFLVFPGQYDVVERQSIFGKEFKEEVFYELKEKLNANYSYYS